MTKVKTILNDDDFQTLAFRFYDTFMKVLSEQKDLTKYIVGSSIDEDMLYIDIIRTIENDNRTDPAILAICYNVKKNIQKDIDNGLTRSIEISNFF